MAMLVRKSLAVAAVGAALATGSSAYAAIATRPPAVEYAGYHRYGTPVCGRNNFVSVSTGTGRYFNVYNGAGVSSATGTCVEVKKKGRVMFTVTKATHAGGSAWTYPNISSGIEWSRYTCTDGPSGTSKSTECLAYPVQLKHAGHLTTTVSVTYPRGYWAGNTAYDIWFDTRKLKPSQYKQDNGAEIMVWLADFHIGTVPSWYVKIGGITFAVEAWRPTLNGVSWNYVAYVAVHRQHSAKLVLNQFFANAMRHGYLRPSWYLTGIDFGPELLRNGAGWTLNEFTLSRTTR